MAHRYAELDAHSEDNYQNVALDAIFVVAQAGFPESARCASLCKATRDQETYWSALLQFKTRNGDTPLIDACRYKCKIVDDRLQALRRVEWLLRIGGKRIINAANDHGDSPLHFAASSGSPEICAALLDAGAKSDSRSSDDWTPLFFASMHGSPRIVQLLLLRGALPTLNLPTKYILRTPLLSASEFGRLDIVRLLLSAGADTEIADYDGETPLIAAAKNGHAGVVHTLLRAGASCKPNEQGSGPREVALARGFKHIANLF